MSALIKSGVKVNCTYMASYVRERDGKTITYSTTPLNEAAYLARLVPVQFLLSHGANVNHADAKGYKPLDSVDQAAEEMFFFGATKQALDEAEAVYRLLKAAGATHK
jgi:hypothetical protein